MTLRIITDSTCDLDPKLQEELHIDIVPLKVIFEDGEYLDGQTITKEGFYQKLTQSKALPSTSQVNPEDFLKLFETYIKQGDTILGLFISSKLSGTYQSAVIAKKTLGDPESISLVDSGNTTFGLTLLVYEAIRLRDQGDKVESIAAKLEALKGRVVLYGVLDTLEFLKKGGRLSSSAATIGTLLRVKPLVTIRDGLLINDGKARGTKAAFALLKEKLQQRPIDPAYPVIVAHSDAQARLDELILFLEDTLDLSRAPVIVIGSVVGTHAGPGAVGLSFVEKLD